MEYYKLKQVFRLPFAINMLHSEQLFQHLPKKVQNWLPEDVELWFQLQSIPIAPSFSFKEQKFDGPSFMEVTPQFLHQKCGIYSTIAIKKILEWLEQDREEFQEYLEDYQMENCSAITEKYEEKDHQGPLAEKKQNNNEKQHQEQVSFKHQEAITPIENVQKWKCKQKKQEQLQIKKLEVSPQPIIDPSVKIAESNYQICENILRFEYGTKSLTISESGKIGRNLNSSILINETSVSRQHAQIVKNGNQYYLQDTGSKFGTYIEIGSQDSRPLEEGDFLAFSDYYLELLKLKFYFQKGTFDLKVRMYKVNKQTIQTYYSQKSVSIGRNDCDITFNYPEVESLHARIAIHKNQLFLFKEKGESYLKLRRSQLYRLQEEQIVRFGLQKVKLTVERLSRPWNEWTEEQQMQKQ